MPMLIVAKSRTHFAKKSRGFSLLELLGVAILLGICFAFFLNRAAYYQELAEKASVESTISMAKSALRTRMAVMMIEGRVQDYAKLPQENPIDWLDKKPTGYAGEFANPSPNQIAKGSWYFDTQSKTLNYSVKNGAHFKSLSGQAKIIQLKAVYLQGQPEAMFYSMKNTAVGTVALRVVTPYEWILP